MWTPILHRVALASFRSGHRRFLRALADPETAQRERLAAVLRELESTGRGRRLGLETGWNYETFARRVPVVDYEDLAEELEAQRVDPAIHGIVKEPARFLRTSGSTRACKWIPMTPALGREFDAALAPWMVDLMTRHPKLRDGRHYWSLSWLPDEARASGSTTDDLEFLPPLERWALRRTMAVPGEAASLSTSIASRVVTLCHLAACRDLRLVSVWSPTFLLDMLDDLDRYREAVSSILARGRWDTGWDSAWGALPSHAAPHSPRASALLIEAPGCLGARVARQLWPDLTLVSAWDSSTSAPFAERVRQRLPHVRIQGKGLWATEGAVSLPFAGEYPVAITSHFLEFRCLRTGRIRPTWGLEKGDEVQPVLSTSGGLLRYALSDRVRVTGHLGQTPCLRFLGRLDGVDLVGEKLDAALAEQTLRTLDRRLPVQTLCLLAVTPPGRTPHYVLLAEPNGSSGSEFEARVAETAEAQLRSIHHYAVARDLGQLGPVRTLLRRDARSLLDRIRSRRGVAEGSLKIEAIYRVDEEFAAEELPDPDSIPRAVTSSPSASSHPAISHSANSYSANSYSGGTS